MPYLDFWHMLLHQHLTLLLAGTILQQQTTDAFMMLSAPAASGQHGNSAERCNYCQIPNKWPH